MSDPAPDTPPDPPPPPPRPQSRQPPPERVKPLFKAFCSARCADIDLNRWLSGAYVIPGEELAGEAEIPDDDES